MPVAPARILYATEAPRFVHVRSYEQASTVHRTHTISAH